MTAFKEFLLERTTCGFDRFFNQVQYLHKVLALRATKRELHHWKPLDFSRLEPSPELPSTAVLTRRTKQSMPNYFSCHHQLLLWRPHGYRTLSV